VRARESVRWAPSRVQPTAVGRRTRGETEVTLAEVRTFRTSTGNTRYVGRDTDGNEYTTFREEIGERARQLEGSRVRREYHEQERGRYRNVYLDGIQPAEAEGTADTDPADTEPEEAAWRTAVDAAPMAGRRAG
jgi:hypothetical protein